MIALSMTPATGRAQLDEASVIEAARATAPAVRSAEVTARLAAASVEGAGLWPNPSVSYQRQQTFDPQAESQDSVLLSVPLALGGRRDAQRGLALTSAARAEGTRDVARSDAIEAALRLFYRALAAERRVAIEQTMREQLGEARRVLASREAAGETSGYATARLQIEVELATSRYAEAVVARDALRARLAGALGRDPDRVGSLTGGFEVAPPDDLATLRARALDQRVELAALARVERRAHDAVGAASLAWIPNVTLTAGYQNLSEAGLGHGFNVQVSVQLPLFSHGQGLLARSRAAEGGAAERAEATRGLVAAEVTAARARLAGMLAERARFESQTGALVDVVVRAASSGFAGGERTLVELIDAQRAAVDVRRRRLELDLAVRLADVGLRRATGALR